MTDKQRRARRIAALANDMRAAIMKHKLSPLETGMALCPLLGVMIQLETQDTEYGERAVLDLAESFKTWLLSHPSSDPSRN